MSISSAEMLKGYLERKRERLKEIDARIASKPEIHNLFVAKSWFKRVEEQISIWDSDPENYVSKRPITVSEYELFRYFEEDQILEDFIEYFALLEDHIRADRTKLRKWTETRLRFFSQQVAQIYSAVFELFVLGKLISSLARVEPYFENIDGRFDTNGRYVYFDIKSLQETQYDLRGAGAGGVQHDEHQILTALKEKVRQLNPYSDKPRVVFLSLYRSADMVTAEWFTKDFFATTDRLALSGVVIYSWFTAGEGKKVLVNSGSANPLLPEEIQYLTELT